MTEITGAPRKRTQPVVGAYRPQTAAEGMGERYPFPMGAREPPTDDLAPEAAARYERVRRDIGEWGAEAGRLARRSARRPRLPETEAQPEFPIGPGGITGESSTRRAAQAVGVPERYLDALIQQESGGDPNAQASTSSATGHAQFIDSTWRRMMNDYGARYGFGEGALAGLSESDVLELRTDPQWAALMAGEYARENATELRRALKRDPSDGEVYFAHFLGPGDAAELIEAASQDSRRSGRGRRGIDLVSREVAEANRPVFYDEHDRPRTVGAVVARQTGKFGREIFTMSDRN